MKPLVQSHPQASSKPARCWLWVDGVGGFMVCPQPACTIGQPVGEGVEIGILADISSRHAIIRRQLDEYVLQPLRATAVDGVARGGPTVLGRRAAIELGSVRIEFSRPHPYSNSARLAIVSQHRTSPLCDGILLAGDSLVLGPGGQSHICCPACLGETVIYRQGPQWFVRSEQPLEIDSRPADGGAPLGRSSRVVGADLSFTFEEAG